MSAVRLRVDCVAVMIPEDSTECKLEQLHAVKLPCETKDDGTVVATNAGPAVTQRKQRREPRVHVREAQVDPDVA